MDSACEARMMLVHAHPDDESILTGGVMADAVARGAQVFLVTCTRGEEGEVMQEELEHLRAHRDDTLGSFREHELAEALAALGVQQHSYLQPTVRDSGMFDTPSNARPDVFWQQDLGKLAPSLVRQIRTFRPHVLITYDEEGGYGHPDHIQAHRLTMYAATLAQAPWQEAQLGSRWHVPKLYWVVSPDRDAAAPTTAIDIGNVYAKKCAALDAHTSQLARIGDEFELTNRIPQPVGQMEYFLRVNQPLPPEAGVQEVETDLFAGI